MRNKRLGILLLALACGVIMGIFHWLSLTFLTLLALRLILNPAILIVALFIFFFTIDRKKNGHIPSLFIRGLSFSVIIKLVASFTIWLLVELTLPELDKNIIDLIINGFSNYIAIVAITLLLYQMWNTYQSKRDKNEDDTILDDSL